MMNNNNKNSNATRHEKIDSFIIRSHFHMFFFQLSHWTSILFWLLYYYFFVHSQRLTIRMVFVGKKTPFISSNGIIILLFIYRSCFIDSPKENSFTPMQLIDAVKMPYIFCREGGLFNHIHNSQHVFKPFGGKLMKNIYPNNNGLNRMLVNGTQLSLSHFPYLH